MQCQSLFSGKILKNTINLLSAELAQRKVKVVKTYFYDQYFQANSTDE